MALPGGLSTFTISLGPYLDLEGNVTFGGVQGKLSVSPPIVDATSGALIFKSVDFYIDNDGTATVGPLVHNDDPNINQGTQYTLEWQIRSSLSSPGNKTFVVPIASGSTVDYDLLTSTTGTATGPYALPLVTSVNGHAGAVTLGAADVGADASGAAAAVLPTQTGQSGKFLTTNGSAPSWAPAGSVVSDATASAKGIVQLAGDLGGTAAAPTVPGLTAKAVVADIPTAGTATGDALRAAYGSHGEYGVTFRAATADESLAGFTQTYNPGTGVSYTRTGATTWADVTTNLATSLVVPPSGQLRVRLSGYASVTGAATMRWGVADGSGDLAESQASITQSATPSRYVHDFVITKDGAGVALAPGALINLRWRWAVDNAAQTASLAVGGTGATANGPASIGIEQVSNRVTARGVTASINSNPVDQIHDVHPDGLHMIGQVGVGNASHNGRITYSSDGGGTWTDVANLVTPTGTSAVWYAGDGEILCRVGLNPGISPGTVWKSVGWATNPATATFTKVLTANNQNNDFAVYFGSYSGTRADNGIIVLSEYGPKAYPSMARYAYLSTDYGSTWRTIFDLYAYVNTQVAGWNGQSAHIHSITYDVFWDCMWVATGDYNGTVLPYVLVSFDWRSATPTWHKVYSKHQFTSVIPMPGCVLFVTDQGAAATDGMGNGILRMRRTSPQQLLAAPEAALEPALIIDPGSTLSTVSGGWTRHAHIPDAPTLLGIGPTNVTGPTGRVIATYDGFAFRVLWTSADTGLNGTVQQIVGPINGKITGNYQPSGASGATNVATLTVN